MIADCPTCGGAGRVLYHEGSGEEVCPDCDGRCWIEIEPEDPGAVREPEPGEAA